MTRILPFMLLLSFTPLLHTAEPSGDRNVVENMPGLVAFWTFGEKAGQPRKSSGTEDALPLDEVGGPIPRVDGGPYSGFSAKLNGQQYFRIPYSKTGNLNISGPNAQVSMFAVVRIVDLKQSRTIAGMWSEGKGASDDSGTRQYAMLMNMPTYGGSRQLVPHVSSEGGVTRRADGSAFPWCADYAATRREVPEERWCTLGFTYDGEYIRAYIDGVFEPRQLDPVKDKRTDRYFTQEGPGGKDRGINPYYHGRGIFGYDAARHAETKPAGGADFTVGARYAVGSFTKEASKGRFGGLAVFDRALSDSQVKKLHDSAGIEALNSSSADAQQTGTDSAPYPRIAMLWSPVRGDRSWKSFARHDLLMMGLGALGLKLDGEPRGLATDFTEQSIRVAKQRLRDIRQLNPHAVILADLLFYEYPDDWLPEDHPWWLRKDGKRLQFWPGTHRMDWGQSEYRDTIVKRTVSLQNVGVDGVFYDNLRKEPEPWIAFLTSLQEAVGNEFLVLANSGYAVGEYDFAAPFLNGIMYESGWSHNRTDWDGLIEKMQHTETLLRKPRISLIERFEETRRHAGWPGDSRRGQKPEDDPAARRWSLCFSLIVGDFYYLFSDNTSHKHDWYPEYDVKIGQPKTQGKQLNRHAWTRSYTGGEVYVNLPGAAQPLDINSPFEARDSLTGKTGRQFIVPPGDGRVLTPIE